MSHPTITGSRRAARHLLFVLCVSMPVIGCHATEEVTGGETHFLTACVADSGTCARGMDCVCGVCTLACSESAPCQSLSGVAECVSVVDRSNAGVCSDLAASSFCDVPCTSDQSCSALSSSSRCVGGYCRTTSGFSGTGGSSGAGETIASVDTRVCADSPFAGNELVVLGDRFVAQSHQITAYLEDLARVAGTLANGERFRDYSSVSDNAFALGGPYIANQYAKSQTEGTVKVVLIGGGGADVVAGSCEATPRANCQVVIDAVAAADQLLAQMAQDGIEHVVWFFYPDPLDDALRAKVDVLRPLMQSACNNSAVPCLWLDLRPTFAGHYGEYVQADGMTPTAAGAQASAAAIWSTMQQNCVAQ